MTQHINVEVISTKAESYKEFYSNAAKTMVSPWDIAIVFSQLKEGNGQARIEEQATIISSPQHFKALIAAMQQALITYETQFGVVYLRSELIPNNLSNQSQPPTKKTAKKKG